MASAAPLAGPLSGPLAAMSFRRFVAAVGVSLTPAQSVLAAVAFDGVSPSDLTGTDRELARALFGPDVETIPDIARHVVVAVCGRAAGKSYVLVALRMLHLAVTVPLGSLAPGEVAVGLIVAKDMRLSGQALRFAQGAAEGSALLAGMVEKSNTTQILLRRPDGLVAVECLPATQGGSAGRGRSLVGAAMDECAFFRDEKSAVNDVEVYRAITPRIMPGGQLILASTPWAESGLLYEFHERNHGHPIDALSAHAPTLLLRDDEHTRAIVERERKRDPQNAEREFDARFMPNDERAFFDGQALKDAVDDTIELPLLDDALPCSVGADFGFRSDSSALVVALRDGRSVVVARIEERMPGRGAPLRPSEVVADFADCMAMHGAEYVTADGHYRETISEHLEARRMYLAPAPEGSDGKAETYQAVRVLLREGRIRLPRHDRLLRQMREVTATPVAGGGVTIASPRWGAGGHGDLVSAMVLAVWEASRIIASEEPEPPAVGTTAWAEKRETDRMAKWRKKFDRENSEDDSAWILGPGGRA